MKIHNLTKAIVKATGEVVSLSSYRRIDEDGTVIFPVLEDPTRIFSGHEIDLLSAWEGSLWEFIACFLQDYSWNEDVALSDDIECALTLEADTEKLQRVKDRCGATASDWLRKQIRIDNELFDEAAHEYWRQTYPQYAK